ncbi:MAG: S8 family peptidase, partial [Taibaiella sp.]|nr:S8 family peptidase [Taibaiella sp.]
DNTSGISHIDLVDRILNFNAHGYTNHGVHINGITGGAGIADPKGEGMATDARLTNHFFSDVLQSTPEFSDLYNMVITNNSYSAYLGSCQYAGTYDGISAGLDKLCNDYRTVFHVFASANDGHFDCPPFPKGYATIAGGYQAAKNTLVVGATDKEYGNWVNSSRGPVKDGRLKPEISAVGMDVNSTTRTDEYLVASGTSMACPAVAGAAALLAERMNQLNGTTSPRSDVLKALLVNGATDVGIPGPDFAFGFGFLNVERSLIMLDSSRYITGVVSNGSQATHVISVPQGVAKLKVLLYWHDDPASPLSAKQLINDIDLEVTSPAAALHKPMVPDNTAGNVLNPAMEKEDRLNNCEQVIIDNAGTGTYTVTVKGFNVPSLSQQYVLAYDFLPSGVHLKYPIAGAQVKADDTLYVYWDARVTVHNFTLEYSDDDGNSWNVIDNNIPADRRHYKWAVPVINSGKCRMSLTRNGTGVQSVTGLFIINTPPDVQLSATQCPGYMRVEWAAVPNAAAYEVMRKLGPAMVVVDTVTVTEYTFAGLSLDSTYYVSVRPIIDGMSGYRDVAVKRRPVDGDCTGNISDGDLMLQQVRAPLSGRLLTSTQLSGNEALTINIRNLDDAPCSSYSISYSINGGAWQTQAFSDPLPTNGTKAVSLLGLDLSAPGNYQLRVAVTNNVLPDPVPANDSMVHYADQLPNPAVTLDFTEDFETISYLNSIRDTAGFGIDRRWEYRNTTDTGRIRSFVLYSTLISGQRSISLDAYKSCPGNFNTLTGTFNLAGYDAHNEEVRLEFDYIVHGVPKGEPGNELLLRGSDTKVYQVAYNYKMKQANVGKVINSGSISLSDILLNTADNFSTSTQLQFGQNDTSLIAGRSDGNGFTVDNIRLYTVQNDVQLISVLSPESFACGRTEPVSLTVKVRNGVNQVQNNVQVNYRLDNGAVVTETIASIAGKETIDFTFGQQLDITASGNHAVDIWITANGDSYQKNDSILGYPLRNQPLIGSYPYFEDFEANDGYWYTDGIKSSWAYGTPAAPKINAAASGQKAWVTNLAGNYNDDESSYLYSPCFDISGLFNPTLSFQLALDIENCGEILCDAGFVDYTTDGENWERLGDYGEGINWYNDSNYRIWTEEDKTAWRPAQIALTGMGGSVQLRFGLLSDPGSNKEGIGVDDVRIFDDIRYPADNNIISISPNPAEENYINIEWSAGGGTEMNLVMTDISGREVHRTSATAQEGYNKTTITPPVLSSGMYFLRITIGDKVHKRKVLFRRR